MATASAALVIAISFIFMGLISVVTVLPRGVWCREADVAYREPGFERFVCIRQRLRAAGRAPGPPTGSLSRQIGVPEC
jgi:hypothetical protein